MSSAGAVIAIGGRSRNPSRTALATADRKAVAVLDGAGDRAGSGAARFGYRTCPFALDPERAIRVHTGDIDRNTP